MPHARRSLPSIVVPTLSFFAPSSAEKLQSNPQLTSKELNSSPFSKAVRYTKPGSARANQTGACRKKLGSHSHHPLTVNGQFVQGKACLKPGNAFQFGESNLRINSFD